MLLRFGLLVMAITATATAHSWPLWESYAATFVDAQGRVIDWDENGRTTSEGQAYAMFFALVADDRDRFDRRFAQPPDALVVHDLAAKDNAVEDLCPELRNIESTGCVELGELRFPDDCRRCRRHSEDFDRVAVGCYKASQIVGVVGF